MKIVFLLQLINQVFLLLWNPSYIQGEDVGDQGQVEEEVPGGRHYNRKEVLGVHHLMVHVSLRKEGQRRMIYLQLAISAILI